MKIGDKVKINPFLTTDPAGQQGKIGIITEIHSINEIETTVKVEFTSSTGEKFSSLYDIDGLESATDNELED